jgi:hypothetical protein
MMLNGRYSDFDGVLVKLFYTAMGTGIIGSVLSSIHPLFMLPCYILALLLVPVCFILQSVARRYEQDEPHYLASRSKIRAVVHYSWVIGVYLWIVFWLVVFCRALWSSYGV